MTDSSAAPGRHAGQIILSMGVILLATALGYGATQLPEASGYAKVGPQLMPTLVSTGLLILGFLLLKEALTGGFHDVDETIHDIKAVETSTDWRAFGWISAGLILNGILIVPIGFVISGTLLFVLAARGFGGNGSTQYVKNGLIGATIAATTYAFFTYGLGLGLPRGILPF